jgi:hypothetical protein
VNVDPRTQLVRRRILKATLEEPTKPGAETQFGDFPLARMRAQHVEVLRNRRADKRDAANARVEAIRRVFAFGFVIANNATYDASARLLAKGVNAVVIAVEYSKAPEHKFPASHDDAIAAYRWVTQNAASIGGDPQKIAIAGESAGGNLRRLVARSIVVDFE